MIDETKLYQGPTLSWSASRMGTLADCERKYFLHYYAAGKEPEIDQLKGLSNRHFWPGNLVHNFAEAWLKTEKRVPAESEIDDLIREVTHGQMPQDFRFSLAKSKKFRLREHEYREGFSDDVKREMMTIVRDSIREFLTGPILAEATGPGAEIVDVETLSTYKMDGTKIYVKMDLVYRRPDGTLRIVDWKTGKSHKSNAFQLAGYASYAVEKGWADKAEDVMVTAAYLRIPKYVNQRADDELIRVTRARTLDSINKMRGYLDKENKAKAEDFPKLASDYKCRYCNFQKVCWPVNQSRSEQSNQEVVTCQ